MAVADMNLEWGLAHCKLCVRSPAIIIVIATEGLLLPILNTWCVLPYLILKIVKLVLFILLNMGELRHDDCTGLESGQPSSWARALNLCCYT